MSPIEEVDEAMEISPYTSKSILPYLPKYKPYVPHKKSESKPQENPEVSLSEDDDDEDQKIPVANVITNVGANEKPVELSIEEMHRRYPEIVNVSTKCMLRYL